MRSFYSSSSCLRGISRAAWRRAVAGPPSGSHQHLLYYSPLRPPAPPVALGFAEHFFSSSPRRSTKKSAEKKSAANKDSPVDAAAGGDPFYVVRKGDVIAIYRDLADCQAQVGNSVCDPPVTVYKGYSLLKETEGYLAARGLRHALYSINAADAKDEMFGHLVPCLFQEPDGTATSTLTSSQDMEPDGTATCTLKSSHDMVETGLSKKLPEVAQQEPLPDSKLSCILEFDGASRGNPGKSGAGVVIRQPDGSPIAQLRESLGIGTCNNAEYRALILGLKFAAKKGFKHVRAQGDSKLVCNQVQGKWRAKNDNITVLCKEVKELKKKFLSFEISHVLRECNSDADAQANFAVELPVGEIQEL